MSLLSDFRIQALDVLRTIGPGGNLPFEIRTLPEIQRSIDSSVAFLQSRASRELADAMDDGFFVGGKVTTDALNATGVPIVVPQVSPALLTVLSNRAGDIFGSNLSAVGEDIMTQVTRSAAGLQTQTQTLRKISKIVRTTPEFIRGKNVRIRAAGKAEEIMRTEVGRAFSTAQQASSEEIAKTIPSMRKKWVNAGGIGVRRGHRKAQNDYRVGGKIGPIPIKQRFKITDFTRTGRTSFINVRGRGASKNTIHVPSRSRTGVIRVSKMLYPRDPAGSAGNVIRCRCVVIDVIKELEVAQDQALGIVAI